MCLLCIVVSVAICIVISPIASSAILLVLPAIYITH